MKIFVPATLLGLLAAVTVSAQVRPRVLTDSPEDLRATEPFRYSVYVGVGGGRASGVVVAPRAYATAGHVVFNEDTLAWRTPGTIRAFWGRHNAAASIWEGTTALGVNYWSGYKTRVTADSGSPGRSSIDTFNLDFAVVYTGEDLMPDGGFAATIVDDPGPPSFLRQARRKTIIGYPADADFISPSNIGRMHENAPGLYETYWWGSADEPLDSQGDWIATHYFSDVVTYGGNSGGPVYVEDNAGRWRLNAVLVGGSTSSSTLRGFDREAWDLVEHAAEASGAHPLRRVETIGAQAAGSGVAVTWVDRSPAEMAYRLERRSEDEFEVIADLPANATAFEDRTVRSGSVYQYRVTPVGADALLAPPSPAFDLETPGPHPDFGRVLGEPSLYFRTTGDAPMFVDGNSVASGKVWGMEASALELDLLGPGQLRFTWSVSSEENPDFADATSPYFGDIYDALRVFLNGEEQDYLTGEEGPLEQVLNLPPGANTVTWEYRKDPYTDEGEDRGRIWSVSWTPETGDSYVYGERGLNNGSRESAWFGVYEPRADPWVFHEGLDWIYFARRGEAAFWGWSNHPDLGWLYFDARRFPIVYRASTTSWLYWFAGPDLASSWFYDFKERRWFRVS